MVKTQWKYLSQPNSKLGNFPTFDIPAGGRYCPGATKLCKSVCYARQIAKTYRNAANKYRRNFNFSKSKQFVPTMVREIKQYETVRIHGNSGDFYSVEYIRSWIKICQRAPRTQFYYYTRSWRIPALWAALLELGSLPNVTMNLSVDNETGIPLEDGADKFKWCYLSIKDTVPVGLRSTDLVFRHQHKIDMKWANRKKINIVHKLGGIHVCPLERSTELPANNGLTCATCRICV